MRLHLSREAMTALTTDELLHVGGAGPSDDPQPTPPIFFTLPAVGCLRVSEHVC